jgi:WD40 repeat protein
MSWSPDGQFFVIPTSTDRTVFTDTGYFLCNLSRPEWADAATWSPDGDYIATGGYDGVLKIYDARPIYDMMEVTGTLSLLLIVAIICAGRSRSAIVHKHL